MTKPPIYSKEIARQLALMTEIIVDVFSQFEKLSWSSNSQYEIGFYGRDRKTKSQIFFGIWYEAWEYFECPLWMAIDYKGHAPIEKYLSLKKTIEDKQITGIRVTIDFQDYAVIVFSHEFFNWENDAERISDLFKEISFKIMSNSN